MKVYLFGWPGTLGGASTKFTHLVRLLHGHHPITVVTPRKAYLNDERWTHWLTQQRVPYCAIESLPARLRGWGVSLCDFEFLGSPEWVEMRKRGLKMAWGNEMMSPLRRETGALTLGQIDAILYVSPAQRAALEPEYRRILRGALGREPGNRMEPASSGIDGWIEGRTPRERLRWVMVGNYIDPVAFPFRLRSARADAPLTIGRLSRPDPLKFPSDFPQSYEELGLRNPRFRVMGWGPALSARWPTHQFDGRWELLAPSPDPATFLQSLDLFVYEIGPGIRESWGRVVVEAMLAGAIPLVPKGGGHHLEALVEHRKSGFVCRDRVKFRRYARYLQDHPELRLRISRQCRQAAVRGWCDARTHRRVWDQLFHGC
jgi:glycosyltransferase involved in cell wall biosynthesis